MLSCDFSDAALSRLKQRYPGAETMRLDLTEPMAFGKGTFEAVVADLCLHYFPLQKTREIFAELHRVLSPGGWLFLRVNAREEYVPAPEDVRLDTDYYVTRGCAPPVFFEGGTEELLSGLPRRAASKGQHGKIRRAQAYVDGGGCPGGMNALLLEKLHRICSNTVMITLEV